MAVFLEEATNMILFSKPDVLLHVIFCAFSLLILSWPFFSVVFLSRPSNVLPDSPQDVGHSAESPWSLRHRRFPAAEGWPFSWPRWAFARWAWAGGVSGARILAPGLKISVRLSWLWYKIPFPHDSFIMVYQGLFMIGFPKKWVVFLLGTLCWCRSLWVQFQGIWSQNDENFSYKNHEKSIKKRVFPTS